MQVKINNSIFYIFFYKRSNLSLIYLMNFISKSDIPANFFFKFTKKN